jgi:tellurite resistance protein
MPKKRSKGGGFLLLLLFVLIWLIAKYSVVILIIGLVSLLVWLIIKALEKKEKTNTQESKALDNAIKITISTGPYCEGFKARSSNGDDYWVPKGQSRILHGFHIGGMVYFGQGLQAVEGNGPEPALIDPELVVDEERNYLIRNLSYWPTYWRALPNARSAYLSWLSTGRMDPQADIGYVFLYFYGLERRVLHDVKTSSLARSEIQAIKEEFERLLQTYSSSGSFQSYAGSLLDLLKAREAKEDISGRTPPALLSGSRLTIEHRLALAQCSVAGKPLPADWAFVWLIGDPNTRFRTPAYRCPEEFKRLFLHKYSERFGAGMILPQYKTRLTLQHHVASPTFGYHSNDYRVDLDLPDVSIMSGPLNKLREIGEECCSSLESFSRAMGKEKAGITDHSAALHLPLVLWPDEHRTAVSKLEKYLPDSDDPHAIPFSELCSFFPYLKEANRPTLIEICRVLEEAGLGIQPDIRDGSAIPSEDDKVMLFKLPVQQDKPPAKHGYLAAALTLRLSAAVALSDGVVTDVEKSLLRRELDSWPHLNNVERARLNAALELFLITPPKMTGLRKYIDKLEADARELLADFLAVVAQVDSAIDPKEIALLEKLYKLLGLEAQTLYSKMHVAAAEPVTVHVPKGRDAGYKIPSPLAHSPSSAFILDAEKIALLQRDSERVSGILGKIFGQEDDALDDAGRSKGDMTDSGENIKCLIGLTLDDSALLQILLTRAQWARNELEEIASDRKIFLDGALELINEKSYSLFKKPMFEGEDPILLDAEVVREVLK